MAKVRQVRPVIFKGGKDFGKVEGIRGLFKDHRGRWFVRKSINGIDKQKTLDFGTDNPSFSVLERAADRALKVLTKDIEGMTPVVRDEDKANMTPLQRGQNACMEWVKKTYTTDHFARDTVSRRLREAEGFAFVTKSLLSYDEKINDWNTTLASKKFAEYAEAGKDVASVDCIRIIKAIFAKATEQGKHFGINPASMLCDIHRKRKDRPDERQITMEQSAMIQAYIPVWCREHGVSESKAMELQAFHYLLTLGMRPSSAILFSSDEIKTSCEGGKTVYRYRVINHKVGEYMPVSQILHPAFAKLLKKMPVLQKKTKTSFSQSTDSYCVQLNRIIAEKLGNCSVKSMRKGFVTATMAEARSSKTFNDLDARRLTHIISDTADKNYNCDKQTGCDKVMEWWNDAWFRLYQHYAKIYKTEINLDSGDVEKTDLLIELDESEYNFFMKRSRFEGGLEDIIKTKE